jgi:hypothetical protein
VAEWWEKLWPEVSGARPATSTATGEQLLAPLDNSQFPEVFGEFFGEFQSDVTDVDKVLIAAAFAQGKDSERVFTTKSANRLLMDQNIKVANASANVRRLIEMKRAFPVGDGRFRVSASGLDYLKTLKSNH